MCASVFVVFVEEIFRNSGFHVLGLEVMRGGSEEKSGAKKLRPAELDELLKQYVQQEHHGEYESIVDSFEESTEVASVEGEVGMNYLDLCSQQGWGLKDPENDSRVGEFIELNFFRRVKLSKTEIKLLNAKDYPESSHFLYFRAKVENTVTNLKKEGSSYKRQANLNEMPDQGIDKRANMWAKMSTSALKRLSGAEGEWGERGNHSSPTHAIQFHILFHPIYSTKI